LLKYSKYLLNNREDSGALAVGLDMGLVLGLGNGNGNGDLSLVCRQPGVDKHWRNQRTNGVRANGSGFAFGV